MLNRSKKYEFTNKIYLFILQPVRVSKYMKMYNHKQKDVAGTLQMDMDEDGDTHDEHTDFEEISTNSPVTEVHVLEKYSIEHSPDVLVDSPESTPNVENDWLSDMFGTPDMHNDDEGNFGNYDDKHDKDWLNDMFPDCDEEFQCETMDTEEIPTNGSEEDLIYPGHYMPIKISVLLIWLYATTFSITTNQLSFLLWLLNLHFMPAHPGLSSVHRFKKLIAMGKSPLVKHFYCSYCLSPVHENMKTCPNTFCLRSLIENRSKSYFLEISVVQQLQNMFKVEGFEAMLGKRFSRLKRDKDAIEDIYDGHIYKQLSQPGGPLSEDYPFNVSFTINTDGIPVFKSSKMSLWPVFLMINELPFKHRKKRANMLLAGLWFGETKPFMATFTMPLHRSLKALEDGIDITVGDTDRRCQAFLICMTADLPAKCSLLNMNQFNGDSACIKCLQTGRNFRTEKGGNVHIFPYQVEDPAGPVREKEHCLDCSKMAVADNGKAVSGIKGPSMLMFQPSFDYVKSTSIDYMHCVLQGITKLLLNLWFSASHTKESFSLHSVLGLVDERLLSIKPVNSAGRIPRSISGNLKFWKATELKAWLFSYSIPILYNLMKPLYLYHYASLVEAIFLLTGDSISSSDIERSDRFLRYFVYMFQTLYGERYITLNMHSLIHLPQTVLDIGPLWAHSCFPFEDANGELLKMFHGTQYIDIQIVNAVHLFKTLPNICNMVPANSELFKFASNLLKCRMVSDILVQPTFLGRSYQRTLNETEVQRISYFLQKPVQTLIFYKRVLFRGHVYHSTDYGRTQIRNSYTIKYVDMHKNIQFGFVTWLARHQDHEEDDLDIAYVKRLRPTHAYLFNKPHANVSSSEDDATDSHTSNILGLKLTHLHMLCENEPVLYDIVPMKNFMSPCTCIRAGDDIFTSEEPNLKEINM